MGESSARHVMATGYAAGDVARALIDQLAGPRLQIAFVFADHRLDPAVIAAIQRELAAPVVGCSAYDVIGPRTAGRAEDLPAAVALGLYGDAVRAGIGVAPELSSAAMAHSRDAVNRAAAELGTTVDALDAGRHVAITLIDGRAGNEEAFCIGSAATAPHIRFVGGMASAIVNDHGRAHVWAGGEVLTDAGVVILLDSEQAFYPVTSSHLVPTNAVTVVTAATGRIIHELDGHPAARRLRQLIANIGDRMYEPYPLHTFARYIDGVPYVRSLSHLAGDQVVLATAVETGHILHVMRPGDLVQTTRRDLALAADRVGGAMAAFLAFSCMGRHIDAALRGSANELADVYAAYPTIGLQTLGEQSGMLLVNHTLTGLAIGAAKP